MVELVEEELAVVVVAVVVVAEEVDVGVAEPLWENPTAVSKRRYIQRIDVSYQWLDVGTLVN